MESGLSLLLLLIVKFPLYSVQNPTIATLFYINCSVKSGWFLQGLWTPGFLYSSTTPISLSQEQGCTPMAIPRKAPKSHAVHTHSQLLLTTRFCWATFIACGEFVSVIRSKRINIFSITCAKYTFKIYLKICNKFQAFYCDLRQKLYRLNNSICIYMHIYMYIYNF